MPITNIKDADPVGTLECPDGFVLDENLNMCVPAGPLDQAKAPEAAAPFKPNAKIERCISNVKAQLRKTRKGMDAKALKSTAIAICRSRLKQ